LGKIKCYTFNTGLFVNCQNVYFIYKTQQLVIL